MSKICKRGKMNGKKKVAVGISGGVDSAVAAFLLKQQGFEVEGATFRLWESPKPSDLTDAKTVCETLGIPHHVFDLSEEFRTGVIDYFAQEYDGGKTPNPCVVCNRLIKFGAFLKKAREIGCDLISTGHYAHIIFDEKLQRFRVKKSKHEHKDQSYILYSLSQEQLGAAVLPLGDYDKPEIREIARQNGLAVSGKSDSQDICFIPDGDYAKFLREYTQKDGEAGSFIDESGKVLGTHRGIRHYTVGQRKGLGISFDCPMFVAKIDAAKNAVILAPNSALMKTRLMAEHINWIDFDELHQPIRAQAKIRYGMNAAEASVIPQNDGTVEVVFDNPQRAITPGQSITFYDGDYLIGGGVITESM